MKENTFEDARSQRVSTRETLGFSLSAGGCQFIYSTMRLFFLYYLKDVAAISAAVAALIIFSTRLWDSLLDPLIGYLSDHLHSRWGQKRPFLLFGALPLAVSFMLVFTVPNLSFAARSWYYVGMLVVMYTLYSLVTVPYNALHPNMTLDAQERSRISGYYQIFTFLGLILIGIFTKPLVAVFPSVRIGWQMMALVFGIIAAISFLTTFLTTKERYSAQGEMRYRPNQIIRLLWANKPFVILCVVALCCFFSFNLMGAMLNYFFKYNLHDEGLFGIAMGCVFLMAAVGIPVWLKLTRRIGKKAVYTSGMLLYALSMAVIFFVQTPNIIHLLSYAPHSTG